MINHAEQDLFLTLFPEKPASNCYETFASMMVLIEYITKGTDPTEGSTVDVTPFDSFAFLPAARTLIKFIHMGSLSTGISKQWPPPILPLRFNYLQDLQKLDTPEHKKLQRDDEILSQLLLDLQLPDRGKGKRKPTKEMENIWMRQRLAQDIFLKALQPVWTEGKLSLTAVVTSQIWLDIIDVCSDLPRFSKQLTYANAYISKSIDFTTTPDGELNPTCGNLKWPKSGEETLLAIYNIMKEIKTPVFPLMKNFMLQIRQTPRLYTWENTAPDLREKLNVDERPPPEVQAAFQQINLDLIKPAPDDDFVITHNPLYSGTVMLRLLLAHQDAGLILANDHLGIFAAAHLYNALRQLKMIDQEWQLMERIIQLHKRALFTDVIPTTAKEIADRFAYRLNLFYKQKRFFEDEKYKFHEPAPTQILHSLLDTELSASQVLEQIEQQTELLNDKRRRSNPAKSLKPRQRQEQQLNLEEFIDSIRDMVSGAVDDASIDYVRLTERCVRLVDTFRRMWNVALESKGLDPRFESHKQGNDTHEYGLLLVCLEAFAKAKAARDLRKHTYRPADRDKNGLKG
ncbi:hypothetical protein F4776DRAFT_618877 [Hypoxylon sp. NC0597]|nr:hypothetical protein F4776DRAFT_618877 [Hypoxylon sp. NC0597]